MDYKVTDMDGFQLSDERKSSASGISTSSSTNAMGVSGRSEREVKVDDEVDTMEINPS
jgi:hypothetical protein